MRIPDRVLRSTTRADLLCVPAVCLGFQPSESVVVLALEGSHVECCFRADLDWFPEGQRQFIEQIRHATSGIHHPSYHVLFYSDDALSQVLAAQSLAAALGPDTECVLVADAHRFWEVGRDLPGPQPGTAWDFKASPLVAAAVCQGLPVTYSREEVVAEVQPPTDHELAKQLIARARRRLSRLSPSQRGERLDEYLDKAALTPDQAAEVAVMIQSASLAEGCVARLDAGQAGVLRHHLASARRVTPSRLAPNVLAILALACWFDRHPAQWTECLRQLQAIAPKHRLLPWLSSLHQMAIPAPRKLT